MKKGTINVQTDNIFPIIKKFLYSDHEIFLRELVSNSVDACTKLKVLASSGQYSESVEELMVEIIADEKENTLTIKDNGIGMTGTEIEKYINEIAFSGAKEFVSQYQEEEKGGGIIGNFGLGFYSGFMVSKKIEIHSKSYKKGTKSVVWSCEGDPEYSLEEGKKSTVGTEVKLFLTEEDKAFSTKSKLDELLSKYCKFYPIPIKFGTKEETLEEVEEIKGGKKKEGEKEGKKKEPKKITVDNIVNNTNPLWKKTPSSLKDEEYKKFYKELYPYLFEEPVFHIHLNIDYPFNLTGVLYFPRVTSQLDNSKNKIQLYCNQVFVTDILEGIVPEFLQHLHGVIDSPDIPLNVSRSYLQSDTNVKKISSYITRKTAEKLEELSKNEADTFKEKMGRPQSFY